MEMYDVIKKLLGNIDPVGESHVDEKRLENLKETIDIVDKLLFDISAVSFMSDRHEYSIKQSARVALKFLKELRDEIIIDGE